MWSEVQLILASSTVGHPWEAINLQVVKGFPLELPRSHKNKYLNMKSSLHLSRTWSDFSNFT